MWYNEHHFYCYLYYLIRKVAENHLMTVLSCAGRSYKNPWSEQCIKNTLEKLRSYGDGLHKLQQGETEFHQPHTHVGRYLVHCI